MGIRIGKIDRPRLLEGCQGQASLTAKEEVSYYWKVSSSPLECLKRDYVIVGRFGCAAATQGLSKVILRDNETGIRLSRNRLEQLSQEAEVAIHALCRNCPLNPHNQAPADISDVE